MRYTLPNAFVMSLTVLTFGGAASGQVRRNLDEPTSVGRDSSPEERAEYMLQSVAGYKIVRSPGEAEVSLRERPLMRWSNPISGIPDGTVVVWTHNGIPEAIAQVFLSRSDIWLHEFQSLTADSLSVRHESESEPLWEPKQSVLRQAIPNAPEPARTTPQRLSQMKQLARRFSAEVMFRRNRQSDETEPYQLRGLPQPIYRYAPDQSDGVVEGAMFAFVQGTNPEVILLIEAHSIGEKTRYKYGLSPMTAYAVSATLDSQPVWQVERQTRPFPHEGRFYFRHHQVSR